MRFMTGDPEVPVLVRLTRNLIFVQAAIFFFSLVFFGMLAIIGSGGTGSSNTQATVAPGIGVFFMLAGLVVFGAVGRGVGSLDFRARWAAIALEAAWILAYILPPHMSSDAGTIILQAGISVAILILLFVPDVSSAFEPSRASGSAPANATAAEPSPPEPASSGTEAAPEGSAPDGSAAPAAGDADVEASDAAPG